MTARKADAPSNDADDALARMEAGPLRDALTGVLVSMRERDARAATVDAPAPAAVESQAKQRKRSLETAIGHMRGNAPPRRPTGKKLTRTQHTTSGKAVINGDVLRPEQVGYTHSLFLQCALPLRHSPKNRERWQVDSGRASLLIKAGELTDPHRPGHFKQCEVPAGPKARLIIAYVNDYLYRNNTRTVPLGGTLREAMGHLGVKIGGHNGRELTRELENFAAADLYLGLWDENGNAATHKAAVAKSVSFWIERDDRQRTLWTPEMQVSAEYAEALRNHMAPTYWPAIVGLQHNARAMDVHSWLHYRVATLRRPLALAAEQLHRQFGRDIKELRHFWPHFLKALTEARRYYTAARVDVQADGIVIHPSPRLLPSNK